MINKHVSANHDVVVVGYDDNCPKEYFNDQNGATGGNGAFIVKDSTGSAGISDQYADCPWDNGGDEYYYISYYDQSFVLS